MHQPRPHGLSAVGGELSAEDSAAVELLARRLTNLKALSGVSSLRMVRTLPGGGYVIAQDAGGIFKAIAHPAPAQEAPVAQDGLAKGFLPMLYSGAVTKAIVSDGEGVSLRLTSTTRRRVSGYSSDPREWAPQDVSLQRFRVDYGPQFSEFRPKIPTDLIFTQYAELRPTWYSGAMAQVIQIVGGYGRQDISELPDSRIERARIQVPDKYARRIDIELESVRLPGYSGLPSASGQIACDYKFSNTHGVGFDSRRRPWLLRVRPGGAWAMPLPIIPATATAAFREYMEEVGDDEIIAVLDRFGAMPSGEGFPLGERAFEAWRRAGAIIKVCDTSDFYSHIAYSSACGWSFNSSGTEGYNTCYDYNDSTGVQFGLAYKMGLSLGPAENSGWLRSARIEGDPVEVERANAYLSGLLSMLDSSQESAALRYKLRRVPPDQIIERSGNGATQAELDYWNNLEIAPIASHTGYVKQVASGSLHHGAKFSYQPQIKFPEPEMDGCVSHDFLPATSGAGQGEKCDTIMFGYYVGDLLKVVKYFRDPRSYTAAVDSDHEPCMVVGSWTRTTTTGSSGLSGHFYTSDIDDRRAMAPVVEVEKTVGVDKGYDRKPFFSFDDFFWKPGTLWRNRYFTHKVTTSRTSGQGLETAICIPFFCRNTILHATREHWSGKNGSESLSLGSIQDPYTYRYWTYDFVMHWAGGLPVMNGKPYPKNGSPVWVEIEQYNPGACSDFADQGSWIPALPADYTWLIHPKKDEWLFSGGGGPPNVKAYTTTWSEQGSSTGAVRFDAAMGSVQSVLEKKAPSQMYFMGSPDEFVGVFYRDAVSIVFGQTEYASTSEAGEDGERKTWGRSLVADNKSAHHFIGVINE